MRRYFRPGRRQRLRGLPPDVLAVAAIAASGSFANGSLAPLIGQVVAEFGVTFTALGVLTSSFAMARILLDLPAGTLIDRLQPRTLFYLAGGIAVVGVALTMAAPNFELLVAARIVHGLGAMLSTAAATAYLARRAAPSERGRAMGVAGAANPAGEMLAPLAVGFAATLAGWRMGLAAALVVAVLALALVPLFVPRDRPGPSEPVRETVGRRPRRRTLPIRVQVILGVNLMTAAVALANFGFKSTLFPLYGSSTLGLDPALIGVGIAAASAVRIPLALWSGALSDRVGRTAVFVPGVLALGVAALALNLAHGLVPYVGFALVYSAGAAASHLVYTMVADRAPPARLGAALGTNQFFADVATVGMPVALGAAIDAAGFVAASGVIAVCVIAAVGIALVVGDTSPRRGR